MSIVVRAGADVPGEAGMIVARPLAPAGETAGFPREPPSPNPLAPKKRLGAAPAMSVAAPKTRRVDEVIP